MMNKTLVVYHAASLDGFTGAWAFFRFWRDRQITFLPGTQKSVAPDVYDTDVYMIGFTFTRGCVRRLIDNGCSVTMIGHHRSAEIDLNGLPVRRMGEPSMSASEIAFDHVAPLEAPLPLIMQYIADAHLYLHELDQTRQVRCGLDLEEKSFDNWSRLMLLTEDDTEFKELLLKGTVIYQVRSKMVYNIIKITKRRLTINGQSVFVANCPASLASDVANVLAEEEPFAAVYYDTRHARHFELRSKRDGGADVMEIARYFGGGGHTHAAGFTVPRKHPLARC